MIDSEFVVKYIIEKLISYTVTEIERTKHSKQIPSVCYDYLKTLVTESLNLEFITYDQDITEIQKSNKSLAIDEEVTSRLIFYENRIYGINDNSYVDVPFVPRIDRAASTSIKVTKAPLENPVSHPESREKKNYNTKKTNPSMKEELNDNTKNKLKKGDPRKEEPKQVELENIQIYIEPPEIAEVRKKKEEEWRKREEEAKKKILSERVRQEETNEYIKKLKDFEKKNVTADSLGNPIFIKGVTYGLTNDFIVTRHGVSEKEQQVVVKTDKSDNKELLNIKKEEKIFAPTVATIPNKDTSIIKKEEKKKSGAIADKSMIKLAEMKDNHKLSSYEPSSSKPYPTAQPAGSNYDFFVPSVGVTISEGTKQKTGGKNFYSIFSKPSVYDYRQLVRDTAQTHYGTSFLHGTEFQKNEVVDKMALTANQLSLPPLLKKTINEDKNSNMTNNVDTIKLSHKINSLTNVFDALDQMPEYDKNLEDEHFRSTNIDMFKNKKNMVDQEKEKYKESINASLEEINKFNHSIMKNIMWGQGMVNKPKPNTANKLPVKPDQKELEKEMGKTIVNTKLPRSRHFSKVGKMKK